MSNFLVTARKWRPQKFEEVVGQEHITTTLKNAIKNNRIAHAYLFAGPRGVGKTTTARILAKVLNCLNPLDGEPCNECEMCKSFHNSQSLDVIEIDGASNRRIEEIRSLRESVKYAPAKGKYKVYIIDEVHMLTPESFNALLKTLEEPPEHTLFIFATTDVHKVPLTIVSRCQRFDFRRIELNTIKDLLSKIAEAEGIQIDDTALSLIAKKADGALRDAESLFDQIISYSGKKVNSEEISQMLNLIDQDIYFRISDAILSKDYNAAFEVTRTIYDNGWNFIDFLNELNEHFRNIFTVVLRKSTDLVEAAELYKEKYLLYKDSFSESDLLRILTFINKTQYEIKSATDQRLKIEIALCQLIGLEKTATISDIIKQISSTPVNRNIDSSPIQNKTQKTSNVRPAYKEEVNVPEVKKFVAPSPKDEKELKGIISKWNEFVEQVKSEKLFFGSLLNKTNPIEFIDNRIVLEVEHPDDFDIINDHKNYLEQKTKEIFGKKIEFNISNAGNSAKSEELNTLAKAVIDKLGGKKI
ncbi:DNA polymerase III subunit tau [Melioribacter roseus P3M-2]|uniref:DNA polymerase III subunit gamma/tau n=1 Tax=Melioribacter roseus (strain DSM 23840 / JCM 17771 / VKM B-2668 / P3M-2) TaxID=1191523 RepID=I6ZSL8_MELRP|nr:DNA polymerase III subunit gamma/tau [Melioribacter roseus]AFN75024.1 DNA polymerase III subunit tau [Melioribacter roseus P3M-2]